RHAPVAGLLEQAGHTGGGGRLDEDADIGREPLLGIEDLLVGDRVDQTARVVTGGNGQVPGGGGADADSGGDRLGGGAGAAGHDGGGAFGLESSHRRELSGHARVPVLLVAHPVSGDVAGVAHRQDVDVRGAAEGVAHLEGRGLLSLQTVGVDRVDELDRVLGVQLAGDLEAVVEVPLDLHQLRPVDDGLGELAGGDLALRQQHDAGQSRGGGVGGRGGAGVARGGAHHRAGAVVQRLG